MHCAAQQQTEELRRQQHEQDKARAHADKQLQAMDQLCKELIMNNLQNTVIPVPPLLPPPALRVLDLPPPPLQLP